MRCLLTSSSSGLEGLSGHVAGTVPHRDLAGLPSPAGSHPGPGASHHHGQASGDHTGHPRGLLLLVSFQVAVWSFISLE